MIFIFFLSGCTRLFNASRYPDLRRVEKDAVEIHPCKNSLPIQDLKTKDNSAVQMASGNPEIQSSLAFLLSPSSNIKSVPVAKIIFKSLRIHHSFLQVKKIKRLFGHSQKPPNGLVVALICIAAICILLAIAFLPFSVSGQSGCLIILLLAAAVCGIIALLISL